MSSPLSTVNLPTDADAQAIQALAPGTVVNDDIDGTTDNSALPSGTASGAGIVEVSTNTDCWILFGGSGVTVSNSTGMFFPKGTAVYRVPDTATHIAYIQDSAAGRISITSLV